MTISDFFRTKGDEHREVLALVDQLLLNAHPGMTLKKKWGLPVYMLRKNIAYLDIQNGLPIIGFNYGIELTEVRELLDFTGRTLVGHYPLSQLSEEHMNELLTIIDVAIQYDLSKK